MVNPMPTFLSPKQLERLEELADASRLRAALYPSPKPPPVRYRSRTRQFPGGRPPARGFARLRRRRGQAATGGLGARTGGSRMGVEPLGVETAVVGGLH